MHRLCLIPYYTSYWRSCISLFNQRFLRHTIKRNAEKKTYKGLTYEYMEYYILTHGTKEERQKNFDEYNEMILISKCHGKAYRYPVIKRWFLEKYPEIAEFGAPAAQIIEEGDEPEKTGENAEDNVTALPMASGM